MARSLLQWFSGYYSRLEILVEELLHERDILEHELFLQRDRVR